MKKAFTVLLTIIAFSAFGQKQSIGIEGGFTRTNIKSDSFNNPDARNGFLFGVNYQYLLKGMLCIGIGLNYNQKGFKDKVKFRDENQNYVGERYFRTNFNYISVPVKLGLNLGNKLFGFSNVGIIPSFLIDVKQTGPSFNDNLQTGEDLSISIRDKVAKFDFAEFVEIGGGYKLNNKYQLTTSLRYQRSFTSISTSEYYPDSKIKHKGISLSIGLNYFIGKQTP